jgi:hypothetical protein
MQKKQQAVPALYESLFMGYKPWSLESENKIIGTFVQP